MRFRLSAMASARPLAAPRDDSTEMGSEGRDRVEGDDPRGPVRGDDMGRISRAKGFTLLELMIVVAIIGILATTAIAGFQGYQLRSKFAEGKTNLGSIRTVQNAYYAERSRYVPASPSPGLAGYPGTAAQNWKAVRAEFSNPADDGNPNEGFSVLGWAPEGATYFDYQSTTNGDKTAFTLTAIGDTDGDGFASAVMYVRPDGAGNYEPCTGACGDVTVPFDPTDCSVILDEVAQVLPHDACGFGAADDY